MVTISAIVPAAGCGARAALNGNKVLAPLAGRPLLWWTLHNLLDPCGLPADTQLLELIVAARRDEFDLIQPLAAVLPAHTTLRLIEGGATRQASVNNAARAASGDFLLVHDAARPLLSPQLMRRVCSAALRDGAAIAALPASDTVKSTVLQSDGKTVVRSTLDRKTIWLAQTPQVFRRGVLLAALERAEADGFEGTDCASLVERLRCEPGQVLQPVTIVEGEARNFKVTYAADLERAVALIGSCAVDADN